MDENILKNNDKQKDSQNSDLKLRKSNLSANTQSRFQVAKVDFKPIENSDLNNRLENSENDDNCNSDKCDTHNAASLRHFTREPFPRASHYRDILSIHTHLDRPTLDELHNPEINVLTPDGSKIHFDHRKKSELLTDLGHKLGWVQGVFIRCLLNIWGVMLFLRLSWVVANAGIGLSFLIIILASVVTTITSLSMSAICTNGEVKGGGTYYMISRSLGPEFGGSIGLIFSLANAVAVAVYTVGFAETLINLLEFHEISIFNDKINDIRIISCLTLIILLCIALIGTEWESKTQIILLFILLIAMGDFLFGAFITPTAQQMQQGFVGWNLPLMKENFYPDFRNGEDFFSIFAIFFPAATGILAGANISGDLKDPQQAIPFGTLLAILITTFSYLIFAFISGSTVLREVCDPNPNLISNLTSNLTSEKSFGVCSVLRINDEPQGSHYNHNIMEMVSVYGPIIYAGIFAATLSSALASLVSAPKVFQALCKDKLFPFIKYFSKGYGKNKEPRRAYFLAFGIALASCLPGSLNIIAPIISNFFLAAYSLINFSCFHASLAKSLGFRPSFKYYNMWISLLGAILCLIVMFIINWEAALATFCTVFALYIIVLYRKPDVNWGSSTQAEIFNRALRAVKRLNELPDHVKNYRPQLLVLTGRPSTRTSLLDFANCISKKISLLVCGHIVTESMSNRYRHSLITKTNNFFRKRKIEAFYYIKEDESFSKGAKSLMELTGIGKLRPNVLLMGYKSNWQESSTHDLLEYFHTIHFAFDLHMSVCLLRVPEGLDFNEYVNQIEKLNSSFQGNQSFKLEELNVKDCDSSFPRNASSAALSGAILKPTASWFSLFAAFTTSGGVTSRETTPPLTSTLNQMQDQEEFDMTNYITFQAEEKAVGKESEFIETEETAEKDKTKEFNINLDVVPKDIIYGINRFQHKQKKGSIDVWWLYDDGGLTLLMPHILTTRSQWKHCTLRVFTLANRKDELDLEKRNMAALLSKFRIDFSDVMIISDIGKAPSEENMQKFEFLISKWREGNSKERSKDLVVSESELIALKDKNKRHVRLRELLLKHSSQASLIVMTLTVPRRGTCSAPLFMSWLEMLTSDMPPFLLVRGNQTSVLTFYS